MNELDTKPWVRRQGDLDDQPINHFELTSARRALRLLKSKLGRERLLELLKDEITAADAFMHQALHRFAGQQACETVQLRAHGISAAAFGRWLAASFDREDVMLAAHPEPYVVHNIPGRPHIVETLGEYVCSFFGGAPDPPGASAGLPPRQHHSPSDRPEHNPLRPRHRRLEINTNREINSSETSHPNRISVRSPLPAPQPKGSGPPSPDPCSGQRQCSGTRATQPPRTLPYLPFAERGKDRPPGQHLATVTRTGPGTGESGGHGREGGGGSGRSLLLIQSSIN